MGSLAPRALPAARKRETLKVTMRLRRLFCIAALGVFALSPGALAKPSRADMAEAKKAASAGKKAEAKKDWEAAREAYQRAVELNDTPAARIGLARAEEKLGHLLEAAEHLRGVIQAPAVKWNDKRTATTRLAALEKRIPTLSFELPGGFEGELHVDDELIEPDERRQPVAVNPGSRKVRATAEGFLPFSETFELAEGENKTITVLLTEKPVPVRREPKPEPVKRSGSGQKTLGYVSLAVGGAGLVVGTAMGLAARSTRNELDSACPNDRCSASERDLYDKGKTQASWSTAGFIVGGVGLSLGTVLLLTAGDDAEKSPADQAKVRWQPVLGPGHVGVHGNF